MNENVYAAPQAELINESNEETVLASRWQRLWASMIDGFIQMLIILPVMYFTGGFEGIAEGFKPSVGYSIFLALLGILVFLIINAKFLMSTGQTVGKKAIGIKIVDMEGNLPTAKGNLLKRYAVYLIPGQIPLVGQFFSVINILFIFGKGKRCIHDLVGDTKVVTA